MIFHKVCDYCGCEFETTQTLKRICDNQHYSVCQICGKSFEVSRNSVLNNNVRKTCSKECRTQLKKRTNLERYGVEWAQKSQDFQDRVKKTCLERYGSMCFLSSDSGKSAKTKVMIEKYGHEHPLQCQELKDKAKATTLARFGSEYISKTQYHKDKVRETSRIKYGVDHFSQAPSVKSKRENTCIDKYGVDNVFKLDEVKSKRKQTMLDRYGSEYTLQSPELSSKVHQTMIEQYGTKNALELERFRKKFEDTCISRYGVPHSSTLRIQEPDKLSMWLKFKSDPIAFIDLNFPETKPTYFQLSDLCGVDTTSISNVIVSNNLHSYIRYVKSKMEDEIVSYLQTLDKDTCIVRNSKTIIAPYELDIYLPEYKLAIECNPTSTHNSSIAAFPDCSPTPYNYHLMKTELCEKIGIQLFHIYGYEWTNKSTIIKSMLKNIIKKNDKQVYARNCKIKEVTNSEACSFLEQNHRQGKTNSSIRYGLYFNGELVSLMCFIKPRSTSGRSTSDSCNTLELVRFCSLLNYNVVGGASKLFKYFLRNNSVDAVKSYSDRSHSAGNLYELLGFKKIHNSSPNYVWVDPKTDQYYHRMNTSKRNLKKFLKDDNLNIEEFTEKQIMEKRGYVQVYDSGTTLWIYKNLEYIVE